MIEVIYNTSVACPMSKQFVKKIVQSAGRSEKKITGVIEVTIVGDTAIRRLNREWRGKDSVTDVLSFAWNESALSAAGGVSAQIYICYPQIRRQAKRFAVSTREEFVRMLVHGLLHSVGYDHVTKAQASLMFSLQEKIVMNIV